MALVPTAPPWLASARGVVDPILAVKPALIGETTLAGSLAARTNIVAAMPSLHQATAVICGLAVAAAWPRLRLPAGLYALLMGVALVYLGEHYAFDVLMGALVAFAAWWLAGRLLLSPSPSAAEQTAPASGHPNLLPALDV
jgi:membrane-associated phospholipid phosphatase